MSAHFHGIPAAPWVKMDMALAWICFDEAVRLDEIQAKICRLLGIEEESVREQYQEAWRELAYQASRQSWDIRGRRICSVDEKLRREAFVRRLTSDDLFNCRWLDFELTREARTIRMSRYDGDFDGAFDSMLDSDGYDYFDLVIARVDLLKFKPKARAAAVRRNLSAPKRRDALATLEATIAGKPASEVNKTRIMRELRERVGLSRDEFRDIWKIATDQRPELRKPGRRKRAEN